MLHAVKYLLLFVVIAAVITVAMIGSNEQSLRLIASATVLSLVLALTSALVTTLRTRAFAVGYVVCCFTYLIIAFAYGGIGRRYLVTDVGIEIADKWLLLSKPKETPAGETVHLLPRGMAHVSTPRDVRVVTWQQVEDMGYMPYAYRPDQFPTAQHFLDISHFAASILLGICNGLVSVLMYRPRNVVVATHATPLPVK